MSDRRETPDFIEKDADAPAPSLVGRFAPGWRASFWPGLIVAIMAVGLLGVMVFTALETSRARAGTAHWREQAAVAAQARERVRALAAAFRVPPLESLLGLLADRLPPGARLAAAARDEAGTVTIAIDTADPDALRAALTGDPHLARLRDRAQEAREDGVFRVRLAGPLE